MRITHDHWLASALRRPSTNFNERPPGEKISLVVVHSISLPAGQFGGTFVEQLFTNCLDCSGHPSFVDLHGLEVSAHLFIRRDGDMLQFVPFDKRAWHAGQSSYAGVADCNNYSVGIELEGDEQTAYTDAQYVQLVAVCRALMVAYPAITSSRIVGHCDVAPLRKTDPGPAFDWYYLRKLMEHA